MPAPKSRVTQAKQTIDEEEEKRPVVLLNRKPTRRLKSNKEKEERLPDDRCFLSLEESSIEDEALGVLLLIAEAESESLPDDPFLVEWLGLRDCLLLPTLRHLKVPVEAEVAL